MPARSDLNPAHIARLLPYLTIVERAGDQFRYRLVGTGVVREGGREATGRVVGSGLGDPKITEDARALWERVFTTAHPIFATAEFCFKSDANLFVSTLVLPLSDDGTSVNMSISSLDTRFNPGLTASRDWLKGVPVKTSAVSEVGGAEDLAKICREWEQHCAPLRCPILAPGRLRKSSHALPRMHGRDTDSFEEKALESAASEPCRAADRPDARQPLLKDCCHIRGADSGG